MRHWISGSGVKQESDSCRGPSLVARLWSKKCVHRKERVDPTTIFQQVGNSGPGVTVHFSSLQLYTWHVYYPKYCPLVTSNLDPCSSVLHLSETSWSLNLMVAVCSCSEAFSSAVPLPTQGTLLGWVYNKMSSCSCL